MRFLLSTRVNRTMLTRLGILLLASGFITSCASFNAPTQAPIATMAPPSRGTARIVVLRPEKGFVAIGDRSFRVRLDGEPMGELLTGAVLYLDRPAGRHELAADLWDIPGVTRHDFTAVAGRTYYFAARLDEDMNGISMASAISPAVGLAATLGTYGGDRGAIRLIPMGEAEAKKTIATLRQGS